MAELSEDQLAAIETYAGDIGAAEVAADMAEYTAELPDAVPRCFGSTATTKNGPTS